MRRQTLLLVSALWLGLLVSAFVLSFLAAANDTLPGDKSIMAWLQRQPLPGQDLSDAVRTITGTEVVLAAGAATSLLLWLRGHRRRATLLAAGLIALAVLQPVVKELAGRQRPDPQLVDIRAGYSSPSFPAGHVMSGTYLLGFLIYSALDLEISPPGAALLTVIPTLVIALSGPANVWLGVHWPSDVVGGWLWALVLLIPVVIGNEVDARLPGPFSEDSPTTGVT